MPSTPPSVPTQPQPLSRYIPEHNGIALMMQALGRRYVRYFNSRHRRTVTLWEGRYRSCQVDSDQYLALPALH